MRVEGSWVEGGVPKKHKMNPCSECLLACGVFCSALSYYLYESLYPVFVHGEDKLVTPRLTPRHRHLGPEIFHTPRPCSLVTHLSQLGHRRFLAAVRSPYATEFPEKYEVQLPRKQEEKGMRPFEQHLARTTKEQEPGGISVPDHLSSGYQRPERPTGRLPVQPAQHYNPKDGSIWEPVQRQVCGERGTS